MPELQSHVVGVDLHGHKFVARFGKGPETFYFKIPGFVKSERDVQDKAASIVNIFSQAYDDHHKGRITEAYLQKKAMLSKVIVKREKIDEVTKKTSSAPLS